MRQKKQAAINLGAKVQDKITGFTGVVTGIVYYLTGCNQALVVPPVGPDGSLRDGHWLDWQRLEIITPAAVTLDNGETPGSDKMPARNL